MTQKYGLSRSLARKGLAVGMVLVFAAGCSSLLPSAKQETQTPWHTYADAQEMFEKIAPGKTRLVDLKALGIDPNQTPNVTYLSHSELLRRLYPVFSSDLSLLDPALKECAMAREACFAYEVEQISLDRKRNGNFWLDFFNFKRQVDISGWRFNAVIVINGETVVYKLWSGNPNVHQREEEKSPLGPFQGLGPSLLTR